MTDKETSSTHRNHLAGATSPYLLQHADNPVDWYPWGDEAIEKARREDKPIFLSIGYAACHWCHVMERESFEDPEIAKILNEHFVAIKVDREERPDIDAVYMDATVAMTGSGGWPMSVFLTPEDLAPFLSGTYFPPRDMHGLPSFRKILAQVAKAWDDDAEHIKQRGAEIVETLRSAEERPAASDTPVGEAYSPDLFRNAAGALSMHYDSQYGGFGSAAKFPSPHILAFLLRRYHRSGDKDALQMVTYTLDAMARSGMYDQVGGGFHRYATDRRWTTPHFEKMLYDQSQLAIVYLEAFQVTDDPLYARIARETLDYVLRDMTDPSGGFHSSEDADSEGEEGLFYTWKADELEKALGQEDAEIAREFYGVSAAGNFDGLNILIPNSSREDFAQSRSMAPEAFAENLDGINNLLRRYRDQGHPRPARDDKVLAAWNANMISALCKGAQVLGEDRYAAAASRAADFILDQMLDGDTLARSWRGGAEDEARTSGAGYLDDYAEMTNALLNLYETEFKLERIDQAERLASAMIERFGREQGGFVYSTEAAGPLLEGKTPASDGATPSPNASAARALLRLGALLDKEDYRALGEKTLLAFAGRVQQTPSGYLSMLSSADYALYSHMKIVLVAQGGPSEAGAMLKVVRERFLPNTLLVASDGAQSAVERLSLLEYRSALGGKPTAYICEGFSCKRPATSAQELEKLLDETY